MDSTMINIAGEEVSLFEVEEAVRDRAGVVSADSIHMPMAVVMGLIDKIKELTTEVPLYYYYASTGCSCCSSDNFMRGPYETAAEVLSAVENSYSHREVCSQYSSNGNYSIHKINTLILPDGRYLADSAVYDSEACTVSTEYCPFTGGIEYARDLKLTAEWIDAFMVVRIGDTLIHRELDVPFTVLNKNMQDVLCREHPSGDPVKIHWKDVLSEYSISIPRQDKCPFCGYIGPFENDYPEITYPCCPNCKGV